MRIAMIGPFGLHPNQTMRARARPLALALTQQGHTVALFMPPWQTPDEAGKQWEERGVQFCYTPLRGGTVGMTRSLLQAVLAWQPDVVYCFKPKAYSGLAAWWLWQTRRHKLPLAVDTDDWEGWGGWNDRADYKTGQKHFFAWQEQWGLRHCHLLTVASRALQTIAWSMGVEESRVLYVPNGPGIAVTGDGVVGQERPPTVLVYSRLFEFETARLVAVLRGVVTAVPEARILLVGAGLFAEEAVQFRQQLADAALLDAVTDAGWTEPELLPDLLRQGDVGLYLMEDSLLNRTKCPVKLADQAALGIPLVGEAVGQVAEYVRHGQTGLLCTSGDVAGLTEAAVYLLRHPQERAAMGAAAQAHMAAHFTWERAAGVIGDRLSVIGNR
jgi:glycosyltransferase involved in cell wall biosynthesis